MNGPTPLDDVIDSRDVIEAIESNESKWHDDLVKLHDDCKDYVEDWEYGAQLIRESYFTTYAKELAEDIGAIASSDDRWPVRHIDWPAAAQELRTDYEEVEFHGVTYLVRTG